MSSYDVIVVGGGHAGIEASYASARKGLKTLLVTSDLKKIGFMSCNPSVGGLAKGHMVKEVDALGGAMGMMADRVTIQYKKLNSRKGPAVRGTRVQCDKDLYCDEMLSFLKTGVSPTILRLMAHGEANSLILRSRDNVEAVVLPVTEVKITSRNPSVLCTGTFMKAVMHFGLEANRKVAGWVIRRRLVFQIS